MSQSAHPIDREIIKCLVERAENGNSYVDSAYVGRAIGDDRRVYIGHRLAAFADRGLLEQWSYSNSPYVYRIEADAIEMGETQ